MHVDDFKQELNKNDHFQMIFFQVKKKKKTVQNKYETS